MRKSLIVLCLLLLAACSQSQGGQATDTPTLAPTSTLPAPQVRTTRVPDAALALTTFLDAWRGGEYEAMYALLAEASQAEVSLEAFTALYRDAGVQLALADLTYTLGERQITPQTADIQYQVEIQSSLINPITTSNRVSLLLENGGWKLVWNPGLILPQLAANSRLRLDLVVPERGQIYDRNGQLLAGQAEAVAVGFYPDYLDPERADNIVGLLARLTGRSAMGITGLYINYPPGTVGYLPLGEVAYSENKNLVQLLSDVTGVVAEPYTARFYPGSGAAPHTVGYVSSLQQGEEVERYLKLGYRVDAAIGRDGIEAWGEEILAGKNGATLYLVDAEGRPQELLGERPSQPAQVITTTLEADFQLGVQKAIEGFNGAIVVMERDTGRVLAMASAPGFDPNAYQTANFNWNTQLASILPEAGYNRAAQGQYPLGSVFKLITAAAGLESGRFTAESTYDCQYVFEELPGTPLYDWTWERFQKDGQTRPSGLLTLPQGLIRSCNPWFYHIGLDLFNAGLGKNISEMARGFGLGQKTGIEGVPEEAGNIPEPATSLDATNIAIGQGEVLVTPLQVARFIAALGNGGTLYRPQLIEAYGPPGGAPVFQFKPEVVGQLPVSDANLEIIRQAMRGVAINKKPMGTAYLVFAGFSIPVYGKTGTATSSQTEPHAWFAGFTGAENAKRPDIAIAVVIENQGEGSQWAAPVFRRVVELYFNGEPGRLYPWERVIGVTDTPTPWGFELTPTAEE